MDQKSAVAAAGLGVLGFGLGYVTATWGAKADVTKEEIDVTKDSAPSVLNNLTSTHYKDYVYHRTQMEPSDPRRDPNGSTNQYEPIPPEIEEDAFDRQRTIDGFNQPLIEKQVCLVLGTGGIGQNVALTLARLGVQEIILIDMKCYGATNLTRQCLGGVEDVGLPKVEVAAKNLRVHNIRSVITPVHCDVILDFDKVVELAKRSTVMFNGIDLGPMWDFTVQCLAKELQIPVAAGQSYGWCWSTELYAGTRGLMGSCCSTNTKSYYQVLSPRMKDEACAALTAWQEEEPSSRTVLNTATLVEYLKFNKKLRLGGPTTERLVAKAIEQATDADGLDVGNFFERFHKGCVELLLPGNISKQTEIGFVPKPTNIDTRQVGSWVCPCLVAGAMMVSQFVAMITRTNPDTKKLPQLVNFGLDVGMSENESMMRACGAIFEPPTMVDTPSVETCAVCNAANALHSQ